MIGIMTSFAIAAWVLWGKVIHSVSIMGNHAPLMTFAVLLFQAGLTMLAFGLLGEMQVRHYHEPARRAPYSVERVLRAQSEEHTVSE